MGYQATIQKSNVQEFTNCYVTVTATLGSWMSWGLPGSTGKGDGVTTSSVGYIAKPADDISNLWLAGVYWHPNGKNASPNTDQMVISGGYCPQAWVTAVGYGWGPVCGSPLLWGPDFTQAKGHNSVADPANNPVHGMLGSGGIALDSLTLNTSGTVAVWVKGGW